MTRVSGHSIESVLKLWKRAEETGQERFNREILPHLDSAYNMARWLARNDEDASDIVQDACIRAFKSLDQMHAGAKSWFLTIVRNTAYTFLTRKSGLVGAAFLDEAEGLEWDGPNPEQALMMKADKEMVVKFLEDLPTEFREVVVLRDLEDLSYKEIAEVTGVPIGTVMSRLNRARQRLQQRLADRAPEERKLGL
jgi:RNA polymerase sigma factor (sigma-70 family)